MEQRPQDTEDPTSVDCLPGKVLDSEQGQPGRAMELQWCTLGDGFPSLWHPDYATAYLSHGTVGVTFALLIPVLLWSLCSFPCAPFGFEVFILPCTWDMQNFLWPYRGS